MSAVDDVKNGIRGYLGPYIFTACLVLGLASFFAVATHHERVDRCEQNNARFAKLGVAFDQVLTPPPGRVLTEQQKKNLKFINEQLDGATDPVSCNNISWLP